MFESALLALFLVCKFCSSDTPNVKKFVNGSLLRITQYCGKCLKKHTWESQPFIGSMPAGNVLTSAAILYAGAFPAKTLRIFSSLNCAMISCATFFRHQRAFLFPAVDVVWNMHQSSLITALQNQDIIVAGDGRADSPGHCAKYGAYSLIELSCNKVLDFKLVQVCYSIHLSLYIVSME